MTEEISNKKDDDDVKDRLVKYGFGFIRLFILLIILAYTDKGFEFEKIGNLNRWFIYIFFAIFGACLNVELFGFYTEKIFLIFIFCFVKYELSFDYTIILYATKTFIPDFFASKLDRTIWKVLLILSATAFLICFMLPNQNGISIMDLDSLWILMALGQLFCELGDQHLEHFIFFRHRYCFEYSMLIIWYYMPYSISSEEERRLFYFDMVAALSYRGTGFILKYLNLDFRKKDLSNRDNEKIKNN